MDWKFCLNFMSKSCYEIFYDRDVKMKCFSTSGPEQESLQWSFLVRFSSLSAKEAEEKLNLYFWVPFFFPQPFKVHTGLFFPNQNVIKTKSSTSRKSFIGYLFHQQRFFEILFSFHIGPTPRGNAGHFQGCSFHTLMFMKFKGSSAS